LVHKYSLLFFYEANILIDSIIVDIALAEQIASVLKCINNNTYINKVEMQCKLVIDDFELSFSVMEVFLDLKAYKGKLELKNPTETEGVQR
jgi:hypothetical protein